MTPNPSKSELESELDYGQLLKILLRRRFCFLGVFLTALSTAAAIALLQEPVYQSQMQLLVEPNYPEKENLTPESPPTQATEEDYATQLTLMRSSQFIEQVSQRLHSQYPTLEAEAIERNLKLSQVREEGTDTRIFEAVYTDSNPRKTQQVLAALQKVYQDYNLEQQELRLTQGLSFLNDRVAQARERLTQVEGAIQEFRTSQNSINPEQQAQILAEGLRAVETDRRNLQSQYRETQARSLSLQKQLKLSSQGALRASRLSQSPRYQALLDELQQTELDLAEQRVQFTDESAKVQELLEQRQRQLDLLQEERRRILGAFDRGPQTAEVLRQEGQLSETELGLAGTLIEAESELQALAARDRTLAVTEAKLRAELNRLPGAIAEYNRLQPEVEIQRNTIKQLLEAQQEVSQELARGGFTWQVVEPPQPGEQIAPDLERNLLLGAVVGLFLGGIAAFGREALDDGFHSPEELVQRTTLPLLGILPEGYRNPDSTKLLGLDSPPLRESLDLIYKNIQLRRGSGEMKSLLVTSAGWGEGKSMLVLGLAFSAARLHQKVLLIDADLRSPVLHERLFLPNDRGLSTFLSGETSIPPVQTLSLGEFSIDLLTAGPVPDDSVALLSSPRLGKLLEKFEKTYDGILLDTPPILGRVDVLQVASFCDGAIAISCLDRTTQTELRQGIEALSRFEVVGIVVNQGKKSRMRSQRFS